MKYIIREGKKRGKGLYIREVPLFDGVVMYCGTKKQRKASRFESYEKAERVIDFIERCQGVTRTKRIVKLRKSNGA